MPLHLASTPPAAFTPRGLARRGAPRLLRLAAIPLGLALAAGAGCGPASSCKDVGSSVASCAQKLGIHINFDQAACEAAVCKDKDLALSCLTQAPCTDAHAYQAAITACANSGSCP